MKKQLTVEQLQRQKAKETKEIAKWEKEKTRPKNKYYLWYLLFIIAVIYIVDEVATHIDTQMKAEIRASIFTPVFGDRSTGIMDIIGAMSFLSFIIVIFYKPLADKYGRKTFLFINTLGMSIGMGLMLTANNIALYIVASTVILFFTPHDMQLVYVMETVPEKHRGKIYFAIKSIATLGVLLIPLMRKVFMHNTSEWRMVYLVPAIVGMIIAAIALLFARETDTFIDHRLSYLKMTDEERSDQLKQKQIETAQGGLIPALKFVWKHKQLRWLFIIIALNVTGMLITFQYQLIMADGYANAYISSGVYQDYTQAYNAAGVGPVTIALFMFPVGSAVFQCISGLFADKLGRKPASVIMVVSTIVSFILFFIASKFAWSPYIVGLLCGITIGSYWASGDIMGSMMISESSPTNLRSSILAAQSVAQAVILVPAFILSTTLITVLGNENVSLITLGLSVPGMIGALVALVAKVKETKGVDLATVRGDEWDDKPIEQTSNISE